MKSEEVRQRLEQLNAEDLRLVAAQLYKMVPKRWPKKKGRTGCTAIPKAF